MQLTLATSVKYQSAISEVTKLNVEYGLARAKSAKVEPAPALARPALVTIDKVESPVALLISETVKSALAQVQKIPLQ